MQQSLALARAAVEVSVAAMLLELGDVAADGSPAADLALVVRTAATEVVTAVPLKPAARIFVIDPAFLSPSFQRLRGIHAEQVQLWIVPLRAESGLFEPGERELLFTIRHVLAAENAEREHLLRRQFGTEVGMKVLACWFREGIDVAGLHQVIHNNLSLTHRSPSHQMSVRFRVCKRGLRRARGPLRRAGGR